MRNLACGYFPGLKGSYPTEYWPNLELSISPGFCIFPQSSRHRTVLDTAQKKWRAQIQKLFQSFSIDYKSPILFSSCEESKAPSIGNYYISPHPAHTGKEYSWSEPFVRNLEDKLYATNTSRHQYVSLVVRVKLTCPCTTKHSDGCDGHSVACAKPYAGTARGAALPLRTDTIILQRIEM